MLIKVPSGEKTNKDSQYSLRLKSHANSIRCAIH